MESIGDKLLRVLGFGDVYVIDGRSRRVPLLKVDRRAMSEEARAAVRRGISGSSRFSFWSACIVLVVITVCYTPILRKAAKTGFSTGTDWLPVVVIVLEAVAVLTAWRSWRSRDGRRVARELVGAGCCASCGYSMRGLVPEPDGNAVCPECGAAWSLST